MRSIVFLTVLAVASSARAEYVNFTVTPPAGQRVTQIRFEPKCDGATCAPVQAVAPTPTPAVDAPPPAQPAPEPKPRKPRAAKKPTCNCAELTAERDACKAARDQLEANLATASAERDAARADLATCTNALKEAAKAKPAEESAPKRGGRTSSRGRGRGATPAPAADSTPPAGPTGEDFTPIEIHGQLKSAE